MIVARRGMGDAAAVPAAFVGQLTGSPGAAAQIMIAAAAPPQPSLWDRFAKWVWSFEGSGANAVADAITPNPAPPTVTPGTGTPQLPSNYNPATGTCDGPCDTSTQATPIEYTPGDPGTPSPSGSLILAVAAIGAGAAIVLMAEGGRR